MRRSSSRRVRRPGTFLHSSKRGEGRHEQRVVVQPDVRRRVQLRRRCCKHRDPRERAEPHPHLFSEPPLVRVRTATGARRRSRPDHVAAHVARRLAPLRLPTAVGPSRTWPPALRSSCGRHVEPRATPAPPTYHAFPRTRVIAVFEWLLACSGLRGEGLVQTRRHPSPSVPSPVVDQSCLRTLAVDPHGLMKRRATRFPTNPAMRCQTPRASSVTLARSRTRLARLTPKSTAAATESTYSSNRPRLSPRRGRWPLLRP